MHGINDGQLGRNGLVLLATSHDESRQWDVVMLEVCLPLLGIVAVDSHVTNQQNPFPGLVDVGEMVMRGLENIIDKLESCGNAYQ